MKKWSFMIINLGLLFITFASLTTPVNFLALFTGFFYIILGVCIYLYVSKKKGAKDED